MNLIYSGVLCEGVNTLGPVLANTAAACSTVRPLSRSVLSLLHNSPATNFTLNSGYTQLKIEDYLDRYLNILKNWIQFLCELCCDDVSWHVINFVTTLSHFIYTRWRRRQMFECLLQIFANIFLIVSFHKSMII